MTERIKQGTKIEASDRRHPYKLWPATVKRNFLLNTFQRITKSRFLVSLFLVKACIYIILFCNLDN